MKNTLIVIFILLIALAIIALYIVNLPQFGKSPTGDRALKIQHSVNFENGEYKVKEPIVNNIEDGFFASMYDFLFKDHPERSPKDPLAHEAIDIKALNPNKDLIVWLGHSSFYMQLDGKKILVDPVFSGHASPFSFMLKSFNGSEIVKADDFDEIDTILISHDHWDHLDYETITALKDKVKHVIVGLGVGEHFAYWGYDESKIHDLDYGEQFDLEGLNITILPSRHFSGRLTQNKTLPVSFMFESIAQKIYYSGDSGYGSHFKEIGEKYGPFDFAIMENGQYDMQWHNVHMLPDETAKASLELKAKAIMPVHNSKFVLAKHSFDEPLIKLKEEADKANLPLYTPKIGQTMYLDNLKPTESWFEEQK